MALAAEQRAASAPVKSTSYMDASPCPTVGDDAQARRPGGRRRHRRSPATRVTMEAGRRCPSRRGGPSIRTGRRRSPCDDAAGAAGLGRADDRADVAGVLHVGRATAEARPVGAAGRPARARPRRQRDHAARRAHRAHRVEHRAADGDEPIGGQPSRVSAARSPPARRGPDRARRTRARARRRAPPTRRCAPSSSSQCRRGLGGRLEACHERVLTTGDVCRDHGPCLDPSLHARAAGHRAAAIRVLESA